MTAPSDPATRIRIFRENTGDDHYWHLDGTDAEGNCTEACSRFATWDEAVAAIPEFCRQHLVSDDEGPRKVPCAVCGVICSANYLLRGVEPRGQMEPVDAFAFLCAVHAPAGPFDVEGFDVERCDRLARSLLELGDTVEGAVHQLVRWDFSPTMSRESVARAWVSRTAPGPRRAAR